MTCRSTFSDKPIFCVPMSRRLAGALLIAVLALPLFAETDAAAPAPSRPNVVWITLDAARADHFSVFGYERETTPNIDALAARGVACGMNIAQSPNTVYSVPSYMTGRYVPTPSFGFITWEATWRETPEDEKLIQEIFRENKYRTHMITPHPQLFRDTRFFKAFDTGDYVGMKKEQLGYAEFELLNEAAFSFLDSVKEEPFFLYVHAIDTHLPHLVEDPYDKWLPEGASPFSSNYHPPFTEKKQKAFTAIYDGSLFYADTQIGKLLARLKEQGLYENTIFVLNADHGDLLGEDGKTISHPNLSARELLNVPLIMTGPGLPGGKYINSFTESADIVPTIVDLLGLKTDATFDGRSLLPLFHDAPGSERDYAISLLRSGTESGFVYLDREYIYQWNPYRKTEQLYPFDSFDTRKDMLKAHPDSAPPRKAKLAETAQPPWEAFMKLPLTAPEPFFNYFNERTVVDGENMIPRPQARKGDDLWSYASGALVGDPNEAPPEITFRWTVPNGHYRLQLWMLKHSTILFKAEDDTEFITVKNNRNFNEYDHIDVPGRRYVVTDGDFSATFAYASPDGEPSKARNLKFIPLPAMESETLSKEEELERMEQMRALGYLD